jgi:serine carboxypeptidase-like clade 1
MEAPFLGTQAWIRPLNYSIVNDWQPWHFQGQVAGYVLQMNTRFDQFAGIL